MNEIEKIIEQELERYARENWEFNEVLRKEVPFDVDDCKWCDLVALARHFYDLGCTRTAEKYDEIEYNRQSAEDGVPKDLEEAARKSAIAPFNLDVDEEHIYEYPYLPIAEQKFIEGAKWQYQKDRAEFAKLKAKEWSDGYDEGVAKGRRLAEEEQADLFTIVALDAAQRAKEHMMREAVEGWVAVDSDTNGKRRVTFFSGKPVRDVLTEYKYWAATRPGYESIKLDSNAFPELKWEDEPKKVRIVIVKED